MGFRVTHLYGLTEVYGPATVCAWPAEWDALDPARRAPLMARQGVRYPTVEGLMVADPRTLAPVPRDGATMGEIMLRGNTVMKGYFRNPAATAEALAGGWFHTGDLAVWHPDGSVLALAGQDEQVLVVTVDRDEVQALRDKDRAARTPGAPVPADADLGPRA